MGGVADVDALLQAIDAVIADHEVGGDAMRWTPEPSPPQRLPLLANGEPGIVLVRTNTEVGTVWTVEPPDAWTTPPPHSRDP